MEFATVQYLWSISESPAAAAAAGNTPSFYFEMKQSPAPLTGEKKRELGHLQWSSILILIGRNSIAADFINNLEKERSESVCMYVCMAGYSNYSSIDDFLRGVSFVDASGSLLQ